MAAEGESLTALEARGIAIRAETNASAYAEANRIPAATGCAAASSAGPAPGAVP
jgi:hypothetical protein